MNILGINAYHGDASAAILVDGQLVAAAEEERFNRIKHAAGFPAHAIRYCLKAAGIRPHDINHVAVARDPQCPLCGTRQIRELLDYEAFCSPQRSRDRVERLVPAELPVRLASGVQLIDVREPWEWAICHLPGAELIPLGQLDTSRVRLDPDRETIVYCHQGVRSLAAARLLMQAGFTRVAHVEGGIDRWSLDVDSTVPRY